MKNLLFVHTAGDPRPYVDRLRHLGFRASLIKRCPTAEDRACFSRVVDLDYQEDLSAACQTAARMHAEDPFDGVLSFSESGVIGVSLIAAHLGLPGNSPAAVLRARNKYLMRRAMRDAGLDSPPFFLVRTAEEISRHLRERNEPMVIKPISGSSSYGVVRLQPDTPLETISSHIEAVRAYIGTYREQNPQYPFEFWLPDACAGIPSADLLDPQRDLLLEGFIPGQQVSVDGIVCDGRVSCFGAIEIERIRDADYFLEYEEWMPTRLGLDREREIHEVVRRAVLSLGLTRSCFHCELKVGPEGIFVIEIAARRGADNISDFLYRLLDIDVYEEGARLAAGEDRFFPDPTYRGAMKMRYFIPEVSGILNGIEGLDALRADPRVSEIDLEFAPGDLVLTPPAGFEFLGYMSVLAPTLAEANACLEELYPTLRFEISPVPERAWAEASSR